MLHYVAFLITIYFIGTGSCKSVRVTEFRVPSEAILGESVKLSCSYDLGTEELYVVKWYKDDMEFYRFEPKDQNQSIYFPQPGIDIDLSQSGSEVVFLRNVAMDSAGAYKCQVSTDAPTYSCVQAVKEMNVVVLPLHGPTISGGEGNYDFGDNLTLNCTSAKSKPAADLKWLVNGKPVTNLETTDHGVTVYNDALEARSQTLRLPVTEGLLQSGKLAIKCEASFLGRVAMLSRDITIIEINGASSCTFKCSILLMMLFLTLWPGFRISHTFNKLRTSWKIKGAQEQRCRF